MKRFNKVCRITTETREYTEAILNVLKDSGYAYCVTDDWGPDGSEIIVMEKVEDEDGC